MTFPIIPCGCYRPTVSARVCAQPVEKKINKMAVFLINIAAGWGRQIFCDVTFISSDPSMTIKQTELINFPPILRCVSVRPSVCPTLAKITDPLWKEIWNWNSELMSFQCQLSLIRSFQIIFRKGWKRFLSSLPYLMGSLRLWCVWCIWHFYNRAAHTRATALYVLIFISKFYVWTIFFGKVVEL